MHDVTRKITFTRVRVFGEVGYRPGEGVLYGQTKEGSRLANIATHHAARGYCVDYEEFREPGDETTIYADCTIVHPDLVESTP